jgi:hypothetical protein
MRLPLRILPLVLLLALPVRGEDSRVEIVRVFTGWRDAASFQRISEFFTGKENTGGLIVLRSQPAERAGYYWLVRFKNHGAPMPGATLELQVVTPLSPEARTFAFRTDLRAKTSVYRVGLTGADWPGPKATPVAWQLRVLAPDGRTVVAKQSYLWAEPRK